jgi:hypothetical protein
MSAKQMQQILSKSALFPANLVGELKVQLLQYETNANFDVSAFCNK